VRVELLTTPDCPHAERAEEIARAALADNGHSPAIEHVYVGDLDDAAGLGFHGSPTLRIDGIDVVRPPAELPINLGCRLYPQPDGHLDGVIPADTIHAEVARRREAEAHQRAARGHPGQLPAKISRAFFLWASHRRSLGRIATAIRTITNVVLGVPSIIAGLFAYAILVKPLHHYSGFAGSIALAFIMLPVMTRAAEDVLNLVPNELRESALAMGAPRWRATLGVIVRSARAGLITSTILAVVRVAGETAPLLFTALSSPYWLKGLFGPSGFFGGPVANLTKTIYDYSTSPYQHLQQLAWGGALLIIVAVLGTNVLVRLVFQRGK